ncbi:MAG: 4-hydroxy-tetrahydrodipicolinate reductase [Capsulimonadaceae bacterium]|nr:4-hydroxy-tetrahydrodipicolinate reductase [Capsulimonadaceae bacterium]
MAITVLVSGSKGRMGQEVIKAVNAADGLELVGGVDLGDDLDQALASAAPQVMVDFTVPESALGNIRTALARKVVPVVGTTGLSADDRDEVAALCRKYATGCLIAPNFALGAVLMMRFAQEAARYFPDAEVIEMHHEKKLDAPSGTAALTAELIAQGRTQPPTQLPAGAFEKLPGARGANGAGDVPVHSVRLPGFVASQMVILGGPGQTLTIRHDSIDRACFMPGVIHAVRQVDRLAGSGDLIYGLEHLL